MKTSNTVPTLIIDKNGKVTVVHKKPSNTDSVCKKRIPALGIVSQEKDSVDENRVKDDVVAVLYNFGNRLGKSRLTPVDMSVIATKAARDDSPEVAQAVIGLASADFDDLDLFSVYTQLNLYRITGYSSGIVTANKNLDLLLEYPHSVESMFELDAALDMLVDKSGSNSDHTAHIREHFAAKRSYPHGGLLGDPMRQYERCVPYVVAVQLRPDLVQEMISFVHQIKREDVESELAFEVLIGVCDELPEKKETFDAAIREHGVSDLLGFLKERDIRHFDAEVVSAYLNTHGAVNEGWL